MPRERNPKMKAYHSIAMAEWKKAKIRKESGDMSDATFKLNFRGSVALRTGKAYTNIKKEYHKWLKEHGHPIPVDKPRKPKKKRTKKKKNSEEGTKKKTKATK